MEGDIKGYFENINHHILAELLKDKIRDQEFIDLYWKAVRAGYVDLSSGKREIGAKGVPQGGVLSPILSNIYLHGFDEFVEDMIKDTASSGSPASIDNPE